MADQNLKMLHDHLNENQNGDDPSFRRRLKAVQKEIRKREKAYKKLLKE